MSQRERSRRRGATRATRATRDAAVVMGLPVMPAAARAATRAVAGATSAAAAGAAGAVAVMHVLAAAARPGPRCRCVAGNHYLRAVAQLIGTIDHHPFAGRKAFGDRHQITAGGPGGDRAHAYRAVGLDDIDVTARGALLHRRPGHDDRVVQRVGPHPPG